MCRCDAQRRGQYRWRGKIRADSTEMKAPSRDDDDRPTKEGRVAVEISVNYAEKTSYFRIICAEIADFGTSAKLFSLAGRSSESSMLRFPAPLSILACLTLSSLLRLC